MKARCSCCYARLCRTNNRGMTGGKMAQRFSSERAHSFEIEREASKASLLEYEDFDDAKRVSSVDVRAAAKPSTSLTAISAATAASAVAVFASLYLIEKPFAKLCERGQAALCKSRGCLSPGQMFGMFLFMAALPAALVSLGLLPQAIISASTRGGGTVSVRSTILILSSLLSFLALLVVLSFVFLLKPWTIFPYGPDDSKGGRGLGWDHYEQFQLFAGGVIAVTLTGTVLSYASIIRGLVKADQPQPVSRTVPSIEPNVPNHYIRPLLSGCVILLAGFVTACIFPANFHWPLPHLYFEEVSSEALANIRLSDRIVAKIYPDVCLYYGVLLGLALVGAAAHTKPALRRLLHSRLRVRWPHAWHAYHPYPHGVSIGECGVVAITTMMFIYWLWYWRYGYSRINRSALGDPHAGLEVWARVLGQLCNLSFSLLLLPASRNSMWTSCFGIPFERALKHHRAMGLCGYVFVTVHFGLWFVKWAIEGTLGNNLFNYDNLEIAPHNWINATQCTAHSLSALPHFDNFSIVLAWVGWLFFSAMIGIALFCRRKSYELFQYTHYFAWVYLLVALLHAWGMWFYCTASLSLYAVDRWIRLSRGCMSSEVIQLSTGADVTIIKFTRAPIQHFAGQYAFINVPSLCGFQWHPFTISSPPPITTDRQAQSLTIHAKNMGQSTWTSHLHDLALAKAVVEVRIDGPYGKAAEYTDKKALVLIAGGIGITPMHAIFADLYNRVAAGESIGAIKTVKLIWSGRSDDTFCLFSSTLYRVHQHNPNNTFSVQLFNSVAPTVEEAALASSLSASPADAHTRSLISRGRPKLSHALSGLGCDGADVMVMACGPARMVDDASDAAFAAGAAFHAEEFHF